MKIFTPDIVCNNFITNVSATMSVNPSNNGDIISSSLGSYLSGVIYDDIACILWNVLASKIISFALKFYF